MLQKIHVAAIIEPILIAFCIPEIYTLMIIMLYF